MTCINPICLEPEVQNLQCRNNQIIISLNPCLSFPKQILDIFAHSKVLINTCTGLHIACCEQTKAVHLCTARQRTCRPLCASKQRLISVQFFSSTVKLCCIYKCTTMNTYWVLAAFFDLSELRNNGMVLKV